MPRTPRSATAGATPRATRVISAHLGRLFKRLTTPPERTRSIGGTASIKTISPNYWLPEITGPVTIDGYTQPGASPNTSAEGTNAVLKVQLSGDDQGGEGIGLLVRGSRITIRGLVINRFGQEGILIYEDGPSQSSDNKVKGNFLGTDASGKRNLSLGASGVWLVDGTSETPSGAPRPGRGTSSPVTPWA
jgi:hypothetical protein